MGTMASIETTVFNLSTLEVMWVPVMPCHYTHWNLDWHYMNLAPFRIIGRCCGVIENRVLASVSVEMEEGVIDGSYEYCPSSLEKEEI